MKNPIRCFDGKAEPYERFWMVRDAAETGGEPEMEFYGYISEYSWFEDDITPKKFKDDLYATGKGGPITIRINSGGGDVIAASMIRAFLLDYPGHVTTRVDGLAASAAVAVAMSGKTVKIQDTAYMMIHDPAYAVFFAMLNIETLTQWLDALKTFKAGILDAYAARTTLSREKISKMMTAETWMSASEAVEWGFADQVIGGVESADAKAQKSILNGVWPMAVVNALKGFENVPAGLLERYAGPQAVAGAQPIVGARVEPVAQPTDEAVDSGEVLSPEAEKLWETVKLLK